MRKGGPSSEEPPPRLPPKVESYARTEIVEIEKADPAAPLTFD
jgi:hypothetical protein